MKREASELIRSTSDLFLKQTMKKLCGEQLSWGSSREVFVLKPDPNYVVKVELPESRIKAAFVNVAEWHNWLSYAESMMGLWLAPIEFIHPNGWILIQRRVKHKPKEFYPEKVPNIFTDRKYTNFGWIGRRFVCCDYPYILSGNLKMRKANWWGAKYLENDLQASSENDK